MSHRSRLILAALLLTSTFVFTQGAAAPKQPAWVARSNENAKVLIEVMARFEPEAASRLGAEGHDEQIVDMKPGVNERSRQATRVAIEELKRRLAVEKDPLVRQDLEIMIKAGYDNIRGSMLTEKFDVPYFNLPRNIFLGIRSLLDDQVSPERRKAALVRLRRYAGMEPGYEPMAKLAKTARASG